MNKQSNTLTECQAGSEALLYCCTPSKQKKKEIRSVSCDKQETTNPNSVCILQAIVSLLVVKGPNTIPCIWSFPAFMPHRSGNRAVKGGFTACMLCIQ